MKFSQRIGKTPVRTILQIDSIDTDLKNRLWNCLHDGLFSRLPHSTSYVQKLNRENFYLLIWKEFFKKTGDAFPRYSNGDYKEGEFFVLLKGWFYGNTPWYHIYDLIEFIAKLDTQFNQIGFAGFCNVILESEMSAYRIVNSEVVPITSAEEINEIEEATFSGKSMESVALHLQSALSLFSDRQNPDYRNSIKESISAVEAMCCIIINDNKATLGQALKIIENKYPINEALKKAFSALYGMQVMPMVYAIL